MQRGGKVMGRRYFAHRGLWSLEGANPRPENSLSAFKAAVEAGYAIELDVLLAADSVPVVVHDEELTRLTGEPGLVSELSSTELAKRSLQGSGEGIPTLAQVVELTKGKTSLYVELKCAPGESEQQLATMAGEVLAALAPHTTPVCVASFSPRLLRQVQRIDPGRLRCRIVEGPIHAAPGRGGFWAPRLGAPDILSVEAGYLYAPSVARFRRSGKPLMVWTVRSPEQARALDERVDALVFEHYLP